MIKIYMKDGRAGQTDSSLWYMRRLSEVTNRLDSFGAVHAWFDGHDETVNVQDIDLDRSSEPETLSGEQLELKGVA